MSEAVDERESGAIARRYHPVQEDVPAGLKTAQEWKIPGCNTDGFARVPRRGAQGVIVNDRVFFRKSDCERLITVREAERRGMVLRADADAMPGCEYDPVRKVAYDIYRESEFVPRRTGAEGEHLSGGAKALAVYQEAVRSPCREAWRTVGDLYGWVDFVIDFDAEFYSSPPLGIAVHMIESLLHNCEIANGLLNWKWAESPIQDEELRCMLRDIQQCVEALEATRSIFAFAYHVPGETTVQLRYAGPSRNWAIRRLVDEITDEVEAMLDYRWTASRNA